MTTSEPIDLDLIDQIVSHVPEHEWSRVKKSAIEYIVDNMPASVLTKLTGDFDGFDKAEAILNDYYVSSTMNKELIIDLVKIAGIENTIYFLDRLDLTQQETTD